MVGRCCVPGCNLTKNEVVKMHVLPKEQEKRQIWFETISRPDLINIDETKRRSGIMICDNHFPSSDKFEVFHNRTNLKCTAVPSVIPGISNSKLIKSKRKAVLVEPTASNDGNTSTFLLVLEPIKRYRPNILKMTAKKSTHSSENPSSSRNIVQTSSGLRSSSGPVQSGNCKFSAAHTQVPAIACSQEVSDVSPHVGTQNSHENFSTSQHCVVQSIKKNFSQNIPLCQSFTRGSTRHIQNTISDTSEINNLNENPSRSGKIVQTSAGVRSSSGTVQSDNSKFSAAHTQVPAIACSQEMSDVSPHVGTQNSPKNSLTSQHCVVQSIKRNFSQNIPLWQSFSQGSTRHIKNTISDTSEITNLNVSHTSIKDSLFQCLQSDNSKFSAAHTQVPAIACSQEVSDVSAHVGTQNSPENFSTSQHCVVQSIKRNFSQNIPLWQSFTRGSTRHIQNTISDTSEITNLNENPSRSGKIVQTSASVRSSSGTVQSDNSKFSAAHTQVPTVACSQEVSDVSPHVGTQNSPENFSRSQHCVVQSIKQLFTQGSTRHIQNTISDTSEINNLNGAYTNPGVKIGKRTYSCRFPSCKNGYYVSVCLDGYKNKRFFKFPTNPIKSAAWKEACNIDQSTNTQFYNVCEDHFEISNFSCPSNPGRLNLSAVPHVVNRDTLTCQAIASSSEAEILPNTSPPIEESKSKNTSLIGYPSTVQTEPHQPDFSKQYFAARKRATIKKYKNARLKLTDLQNRFRKQKNVVKSLKKLLNKSATFECGEPIEGTTTELYDVDNDSTNRYWLNEEKLLALDIFNRSPRIFKFLRANFLLPSVVTPALDQLENQLDVSCSLVLDLDDMSSRKNGAKFMEGQEENTT